MLFLRYREILVAVAALALWCQCPSVVAAQSSAIQRAITESREFALRFEVRQSTSCANPGSDDQLTIVFSNEPGDMTKAPMPVLGPDILQEFSFSGRDIHEFRSLDAGRVQGIRFVRRVRDRGFLDARFIRVINVGDDGWCGGSLSLTIDNVQLLVEVPLSPVQGTAGTGIQGWNRNNWSQRAYWEGNLQSLLRPPVMKK